MFALVTMGTVHGYCGQVVAAVDLLFVWAWILIDADGHQLQETWLVGHDVENVVGLEYA